MSLNRLLTLTFFMPCLVWASDLATTQQKLNFATALVTSGLKESGLELVPDSMSVHTGIKELLVNAMAMIPESVLTKDTTSVELNFINFAARDATKSYSGYIYILSCDERAKCLEGMNRGIQVTNPVNGRSIKMFQFRPRKVNVLTGADGGLELHLREL